MFNPGDTFDRYRIDAVVGQGGMGKVYKAYDTRLQRTVALKVLHEQDSGGGSSGTARIIREARAAAALAHPNVLVTHDLGVFDGTAYIAMEYVQGVSLRDLVGNNNVPVAKKIGWLIDVAKALVAAHEAGIVHRDIKPENVMIRKDSVVKVLDFGIARRAISPVDPAAQTERDGLATITAKGSVIGTLAYMAPEQVRGEPLDGRADQFAWGVMAYELLTGVLPWKGLDSIAVIASIVSEHPIELSLVVPEVPQNFSQVITRALAKNKEERFRSMSDIVALFSPTLHDTGALVGTPPGSQTPALEMLSTVLQQPAFPSLSSSSTSASTVPNAVDSPRNDNQKSSPRDIQTSSRKRASVVVAVLSLTVMALGGVWLRPTPTRSGPNSAATSANAHIPSNISTLASLATPKGCSEAATKAYHEALLELRSRGWEAARKTLDRAAINDPDCASIQFRRAWVRMDQIGELEQARIAYQLARRSKDDLSERDAGALEALGHLIAVGSPSVDKACSRISALQEKYPHDAELLWAVSKMCETSLPVERRREMLMRAISLDPLYGDPWQTLAQGDYQEDLQSSVAIIDECATKIPTFADCHIEACGLAGAIGSCQKMLASARSFIATEPNGEAGYWFLANALAATNATKTATEDVLHQFFSKTDPQSRSMLEPLLFAQLSALHGDFEAALTLVDKSFQGAKLSSEQNVHSAPSVFAVLLHDELGDTTKASKLATDFVGGLDAWVHTPSFDNGIIGLVDAVPLLCSYLQPNKEISHATCKRESDRWRQQVTSEPLQWLALDARNAKSPHEARASLSRAPNGAIQQLLRRRLPYSASASSLRSDLATTLQFAGRLDEALAAFALASRDCFPLLNAITAIRAHELNGEALEMNGNKDEACSEYSFVLSRWGNPGKSRTAERAKIRHRFLKCP